MIPLPAAMHARKARLRHRAGQRPRLRVVGIAASVFHAAAVRRQLVEAEHLAPEEPFAVLHDGPCRFPVNGNYAECPCSDLWLVRAEDT